MANTGRRRSQQGIAPSQTSSTHSWKARTNNSRPLHLYTWDIRVTATASLARVLACFSMRGLTTNPRSNVCSVQCSQNGRRKWTSSDSPLFLELSRKSQSSISVWLYGDPIPLFSCGCGISWIYRPFSTHPVPPILSKWSRVLFRGGGG